MFLTTEAGNSNTQCCEVEIFLHVPSYSVSYIGSVTQIGQFQSGGRTWTVAIDRSTSRPDILFMPSNQADITTGTVDLKAMLTYLVNQKILSNSLYFNGLGFGTETHQGSGSMQVNSLSIIYN